MRHYMVECAHFASLRKELGIADLLRTAPRITSKSGWITFGAAPRKKERLALLCAVSTPGIQVATFCRVFLGQFEEDGRGAEDAPT